MAPKTCTSCSACGSCTIILHAAHALAAAESFAAARRLDEGEVDQVALRESPAPIARIAAEVGYESESTFSRAFAREMDVPPGQFRQVPLLAR